MDQEGSKGDNIMADNLESLIKQIKSGKLSVNELNRINSALDTRASERTAKAAKPVPTEQPTKSDLLLELNKIQGLIKRAENITDVKETPVEELKKPSRAEEAVTQLGKAVEANVVNPLARLIPQATEKTVDGREVSARPTVPRLKQDISRAFNFLFGERSQEQDAIDAAVQAVAQQLGMNPEEFKKSIQERGETTRQALSGFGRLQTDLGTFKIDKSGRIVKLGE